MSNGHWSNDTLNHYGESVSISLIVSTQNYSNRAINMLHHSVSLRCDCDLEL